GWLAFTGRRRLHAVAGDVRFGEEQQAGVLSPSHREDEALVGDRVVDADLLRCRLLVRGRLGCGLTADAALAAEVHPHGLCGDARLVEAAQHAGSDGGCWGGEGDPTAGLHTGADTGHHVLDGLHLATRL